MPGRVRDPNQKVVQLPPDSTEDPQAAVEWLVRRAARLADEEKAENCISLAYDISPELTAAEIKRRRGKRARR